tara:strand:- start:535 stop:837 length:303 start_codon:yes stop_codon:yes gene_type:complete
MAKDYPALFNKVKQEAKHKGYVELLDYLNDWCDLYQHQNRYTGCINSQKLFEHEMDCWEKNLPTPALPFKTITKQARDLGLKCKGARNDFVGYMQMREYY